MEQDLFRGPGSRQAVALQNLFIFLPHKGQAAKFSFRVLHHPLYADDDRAGQALCEFLAVQGVIIGNAYGGFPISFLNMDRQREFQSIRFQALFLKRLAIYLDLL